MAIDYTASNKDQIHPDSLHYIGGSGINKYQKAIQTIGGILECYDTDKKFAVYGFGGVPYYMQVSDHPSFCFPLNGNESDPEI